MVINNKNNHTSFDKLNIIQWNARGISTKEAEFIRNKNLTDLFLISETWLNKESNNFRIKDFKLKGFDIIRNDRIDKQRGGTAILIKNSLKYQIIKNFYKCNNKLEASIIKVYVNNDELFIVSCYRPPNNNINTNEWTLFFNQFINKKFIIAGDFNAHHQSWGNNTSCPPTRRFTLFKYRY